MARPPLSRPNRSPSSFRPGGRTTLSPVSNSGRPWPQSMGRPCPPGGHRPLSDPEQAVMYDFAKFRVDREAIRLRVEAMVAEAERRQRLGRHPSARSTFEPEGQSPTITALRSIGWRRSCWV
jgi:hypothetical protein